MNSHKEYSEYLKMCFWFLFVCEVLVLGLALIFGHSCGYRNSFIAFGTIGAIIGLLAIGVLVLLKFFDRVIDKYNGNKN